MIKNTEKLSREHFNSFLSELKGGLIPLDFKIGGKNVKELLGNPILSDGFFTRKAIVGNVEIGVTYRILNGAVEIVAELTNNGVDSSEQISDIYFCDMALPDAEPYKFSWGKRRVLYSVGSPSGIYDFQPREEDIARPESLHLEETGGRASENYMPYFNCSSCDREGIIAAIGWSGHWKADFTNGQNCMQIKLSYPADFHLKAGESVKLPSVLLMPWKRECDGDRDLTDTFILFRRIMRDGILPKGLTKGQLTLRAWGGASTQEHESRFKNIKRLGIPHDAYGIDAGWYDINRNGVVGDWWKTVGDWHEAESVHPNGLEWLSDKARKAGSKGFWLWFEFERAMSSSDAVKAHPEYYLYETNPNESQSCVCLVNMGDPNAREYMRSILYPVIRRVGVTMFRVDFNINPQGHFKANDGENRKGITELKYYNGLYEFFAQMLNDFPELVIDNCAAGGRRLDYRMCSFGVPVNCRSDYFTIPNPDANGFQAQTIGLARWLPVYGDSAYSCTLVKAPPKDTYDDRSVYGCNFALTAFQGDLTEEEGEMYKKIVNDALLVREYMPLDFYPLTGYSYSPRDWCAYETCAEDSSKAMLVAFRRELNNSPEQVFALKGLNENFIYEITDLDCEETKSVSGKELIKGYRVSLPAPRSSKILLFKAISRGEKND